MTRSQAAALGEAALNRFDEADGVISRLVRQWGVEIGAPLGGATCSLLFEVRLADRQAVLKYPLDPDEATYGTACLGAFSGHGGINVLEVDGSGAILMDLALPGCHLHEVVTDDEEAVRIAARIIRQLRCAPNLPGNSLDRWYDELYEAYNTRRDVRFKRAIEVYEWLRHTSPPPRLIHGDLHHYNLLSQGEDWAVIDPKGVTIDPSYEPCSFMRNPYPQIGEDPNLIPKTRRRIELFAEELGDDPQRIWGWSFAQVTLDSSYDDDFSLSCTKVSQALWIVGLSEGYARV